MMQNKPEAKDKWIRTCPKDVKSCFWAQGDGSPKENGWYLGNGNNLLGFTPIIVSFYKENRCEFHLTIYIFSL